MAIGITLSCPNNSACVPVIHARTLRDFTGSGIRKERTRFFEYVAESERTAKVLTGLSQDDIAKIFDDLMIYAGFRFEQPYEGTREDHASLRTFTSRLINRFINAVEMQQPRSYANSTVLIDKQKEQEIAILKQLTWFYVIEAPGLAIQHEAQKKIIDRLVTVVLSESMERKPSGVLPIAYRELLKNRSFSDVEKKRAAIDLIASMTESQAIDFYRRLEGISLGSGLDRVLV